MKFNI